jgi:hypothetical protein
MRRCLGGNPPQPVNEVQALDEQISRFAWYVLRYLDPNRRNFSRSGGVTRLFPSEKPAVEVKCLAVPGGKQQLRRAL